MAKALVKFAPLLASWLKYGALELPMTELAEVFSNTTTTTWSGRGTDAVAVRAAAAVVAAVSAVRASAELAAVVASADRPTRRPSAARADVRRFLRTMSPLSTCTPRCGAPGTRRAAGPARGTDPPLAHRPAALSILSC